MIALGKFKIGKFENRWRFETVYRVEIQGKSVSITMASKAKTGLERRELLKLLQKANKIQRAKLLEIFPAEIVKLLSECALNILKGTVVLKKDQKKKLRRYRQKLHTLVDKQVPQEKKKKVIQSGGFLPAILGTILGPLITPLVTPLVQELAKKI